MAALDFRRLTRDDFDRLGEWLAEPHVSRWWAHDHTPEAVERDFGPGVDGAEPGEDHVVLLDGDPIGLIQFARLADYPEYTAELGSVIEVPARAVTIDYLIGDPELVGRGLGPAMIAAFCERVWTTSASCILVPVNSANVASWRALVKAGFEVVARGELDPDNPADGRMHEVLRLDRPAPRSSTERSRHPDD